MAFESGKFADGIVAPVVEIRRPKSETRKKAEIRIRSEKGLLNPEPQSAPSPSPPKEERETEPRIPSINLLIQWQCSLRGGERALEIADRGSFAMGSRNPTNVTVCSVFGFLPSDFCLLTYPGVLTRAAYLSTVCPCTRSGEPMGGNTGQSRRTKCANGLSRAGPMLKPKCGRKAPRTGSCSTSFLSSPKPPSSLRREVRLPHFLSRPVPGPIRWPRPEWSLASCH